MIETLISSKTRVRLLLKFFLNPSNKSHLRGLESEFKESTNAIRLELNRFEEAGLLHAEKDGNKKVFGANTAHPLFRPIQNLIRSYVGIDHLIENVIDRLGDIHMVYLTGDYAQGKESNIIDLVIVGDYIDKPYLSKLALKAESFLKRKIRHVVYSTKEWTLQPLETEEKLLIFARDAE